MLIPSLDRDTCVAETVRRQLARPFARSAGKEEAVIRERFPIYVGLRARKIDTMHPLTVAASVFRDLLVGNFRVRLFNFLNIVAFIAVDGIASR